MNIKSLIFTLILLVKAPLFAMNPCPGTVIDPIKHNGQYTAKIAETSLASLPSGLPTVAQLSQASSDLFKNKGIPVIITTGASMVPWWALTTGTGYLLISHYGISNPMLLATAATGASYVVGEQTGSLLKKCIDNSYIKNSAQVALCATCIGLSYMSNNPLITDALSAMAQAIGIHAILDNSMQLLTPPSLNSSHDQPQSWYSLSPETKENIINGTTNALSTILPSLCITNACEPNAMLRILLYEQAYRLAQCGCAAAQHFIQK